MTDKACAKCVKRHDAGSHLQCRARPPASGPGGHAQWPIVRPADYCHSDFEAEPAKAPRKPRPEPELPL